MAVAFPVKFQKGVAGDESPMPVIGFIGTHEVEEGETLLDIARKFSLGYNQIVLYHSEMDPWLPPEGAVIDIPTKWIVPVSRYREVVINIPEMRLYRYFEKYDMIKTYPIGIGREGFNTPVTETRVMEKIEKPSWTVPPNAREKYGARVVPPGPDNPLGDYWIGLGEDHIGIHGTNFAWGVGRRVSHGCIRLYPEHIERFVREVDIGTVVEITYEPVKVGKRGDVVFLEVHPDIYGRIPDIHSHAWEIIDAWGLSDHVDPGAVDRCIAERKGVPTRVGIDNQVSARYRTEH